MKIKTLNEWLNESNQGFLEPTEENLRKYDLDPNKVTINPDGSIYYDGPVDLSSKGLTSIPFTFNKVTGDFSCSDNQLVSLEGCPEVVGGNFNCSFNRLTSLQGAPKQVGRDFYCFDNQLTSLQGAPVKVGRDFNCYNNRLTSLQGAPKQVGGEFDCSFNRLTSLQGAPDKVKRNFVCSYNQLTSLQGAPAEVGGVFNCSFNHILYNPTKYEGSFDINKGWKIKDPSGEWARYSGSDHLRMAFERLGELSKEEILGIEEGLKKVDVPDDLRRYCEDKLYKFQVKYNPKTKTQKFFHDAEMADDLLGMI